MNKIKKGNLNYDQSGRAYPDNPKLKENWDCIWKYGDKYYELVGDDEHKEWEEVNIHNQIIDDVYKNYLKEVKKINPVTGNFIHLKYPEEILSKEVFINKCKTDPEFSEKWGLKIEERELSFNERYNLVKEKTNENPLKYSDENGGYPEHIQKSVLNWMEKENTPTKLITLTYNNETIEVYEPIR